MTEETEADTQRAQRSALGGFERDAKTFDGHLQRILGSADAFVKRCAKFALQEPDHPRLTETATLLAEAKRILGEAPAQPVAAPALSEDARGQIRDLQRRVAHIEIAMRGGPAVVGALPDGQKDVTGMDPGAAARIEALPPAPVPAVVTEARAAAAESATHLADAEARARAASLQSANPMAKLSAPAQARVQAAIDKAAVAPFPAEPAAAPFNPFSAFQ